MRWFTLLFLALFPGQVLGWPTNGTRLTAAPDAQANPRIASDGAGGAFVAWDDLRDYSSDPANLWDCYLQRVTAVGEIQPGWPLNGLPLAIGAGGQAPAAILPDGSGGALIVVADTRFDYGDLYLHRITATGVHAPGWTADGVPIGVGPREQFAPELVLSGAGGIIVSWQDSDNAGASHARYLHVLGNGQIAPGWPEGGRVFSPEPFQVSRPLMLPSASDGFLACWGVAGDAPITTVRMRAQRFTSAGDPDPTWPVEGVEVCPALPSSRGPVERLVPDGSGGFYTVFPDYRASPPESPNSDVDVYAQHVLGTGAIAAGWPAGGVPVGALSGTTQQYPSLCEDGQGGAFFAWEDYRSGAARLFAQHLQSDGQRSPGWPELGLAFTATPGFQLSPKLAWDGYRGAYVAWMNLHTGGYRSYVQHLGSGGAPWPGWPASGLPVVPIVTDQYVPVIAADGLGGAIVAWEDRRDGAYDVYAQKFVTDGVVATQVSLAEAEADANEVRIRWQVKGESSAMVERREGTGDWKALIELTSDGSGYMILADRDVRPGTSYEYRLAFASGVRGGAVALEVPAAFVLALEGARPNPATGPLWVAFTLPGTGAARLELYDLSGRRLALRDMISGGAGRHVVRLDDNALAPGLYWASLTHAGRTIRSRVAIVR